MKARTSVLAAALAVAAGVATQDMAGAHGGTWRGPGDLVPPGGGGNPGGSGPPPGGTSPAGPDTPVGGIGLPPTGGTGTPSVPGQLATDPLSDGGLLAPDTTRWSYWWEFNKDPYLNLKANVWSTEPTTGGDAWWLGKGQKIDEVASLRPSDEQIRGVIVPALERALATESSNDVVTGAMLALARIGEDLDESGHSAFVPLFERFLADSNQEIAETAALALGLLGHEAAGRGLLHLAADDARGRELVGAREVNVRTRSFAVYGLGLVGRKVADEELRVEIVDRLARVLDGERGATADLQVASVSAFGLVPLERMVAEPSVEVERRAAGAGDVPRVQSREQQVQLLLSLLDDDQLDRLTRAHVPTALARLLDSGAVDDSGGMRSRLVDAVVSNLAARLDEDAKEDREVVQSAVLALGALSGGGGDEREMRVREALVGAFEQLADQQARNFACVALARSACRPDGTIRAGGGHEAAKFLSKVLSRGKSATRTWSALGLGILARGLAKEDMTRSLELVGVLESALAEERNPERVGAYAIAAGLAGEPACEDELLEQLDRVRDMEARGYVALGLGLVDSKAAIEPIQRLVRESKYRPDLLRQAAIALGLLGDKTIVGELVGMLEQARGLASQAAIATALGFIGDRDSVEPLVAMLEDRGRTDLARAFAAVALGLVADDDRLPWNTCLAVDFNYRAATATLVDPGGTGVLDIR